MLMPGLETIAGMVEDRIRGLHIFQIEHDPARDDSQLDDVDCKSLNLGYHHTAYRVLNVE